MYPSDPVIIDHLEVKVIGNLEKALKAFRAIVQKEKILSDYKESQRFEKPSDKKRRQRNEAALSRLEDQGIFKNPKSPTKKHKNKNKNNMKGKDAKPQEIPEVVMAEMALHRKIEQRRQEAATVKK